MLCLAKISVLLGLSSEGVFPLAPAGLGPSIHEDRATHCWLDLAADASAHPEGRDWVAGSTLDLLVVLSVLAENGPVAELAGREVLFLEGWHKFRPTSHSRGNNQRSSDNVCLFQPNLRDSHVLLWLR